ncbi:hypothetical protein V8G54_002864 [Vigna mungo]|uniref:Uncharacterized protein n=1 Tax=Vigna mungo TaxID=3915 RepID=A0AAQ3PBT8_VIGMU
MSSGRVKKKAVQVYVKDVGDVPLRSLKRKYKQMSNGRVEKKTVQVDVKDVGYLSLRNPNIKRCQVVKLKQKTIQVDVKDVGDLSLRKLKGKQKDIGESSHGKYCGICMDAKP